MMKRISAIVLALSVSVVLALGCFAADTTGTATYDGSKLNVEGDMSGFSSMVPGLPQSGSVQLKNASDKTANFYMNTDVVSTLITNLEGAPQTAYTVSLSCGDTVLYGYDPATGATGSLVGGMDTQGLEELNGDLEGYLLVATLKPGETADVNFSITPDARSTTDYYQFSEGLVEFRFQVRDVEPIVKKNTITKEGEDVVVTQTRYVVEAAKTGDTNLIFVAASLLALALVILVVTKKKKKEDQ